MIEIIHIETKIKMHWYAFIFCLNGYNIERYRSRLIATRVKMLTLTLSVEANGAILHIILGNIHF